MKKKTLLITMVLTIVMSTSVFAAGGDNYGEDIFGTTSSQVTTTKASATEKTTDKENIKNNVETCATQNDTENKNILKIRILNIYIIKLFYYKKQLFLISIIPQTLWLRN